MSSALLFSHSVCTYPLIFDVGATPANCGSTPEGGVILVPYTATYTCYTCG